MSTVTIAQGELQGGICKTDSGFEYFEFLGIPYAKPPIGILRFQSPQSPVPWEGVRDATSTDSSTISCQMDIGTGSVIGSEDCLYLNVYTPTLPADDTELKAVLVLSHGGGFVAGNGTIKNENGPDYLVEHDIVVVTINYRLGPLGYLSLQIPKAAGNMGLKDHVKALQWVQNNIDKFGGNKDNVTICGVSAGSASCEYLILSPLTKGLFHKCILESGSTLNNWAINFPTKATTMALKLAQELGYKGANDDKNAIFKILSEASAPDLTKAAYQMTEKHTLVKISFGFVPTIEKDFGNGDAFLTDAPYKMLKAGKFNHVSVIRGFCNKEGTLVSAMKPKVIGQLIETKAFTHYWVHKLESNDITKYNSKLIKAYIDNAKPSDKSEEFALNFFGDLNIAAGVYLAGKLQCKKIPVYMYKFCYDGKLNVFKALFGLDKEGAAHTDESGYLVRHIVLASHELNDADILMRKRMTKMWTNFTKTGNPTPDDCPELPVRWPLFTENSKVYLNIDKEFTVHANYEPEKMAIFEELMEKYLVTRELTCPCYDGRA